MKKLIKWFKPSLTWFDDNLVHLFLSLFIIITSLFPKIPYSFVEYTYIRIRYDDAFPVILVGIFAVQWFRKKIVFNKKFFSTFIIFWIAVFISFTFGYFFKNTVPVRNIGLLHALRRIQYMSVFFVASSSIVSQKRFYQYMRIYFVTLLLVAFYGIGQRFLQFPSIQSMNPAYVDGRILTLNASDRVNSTFGGHFDLAAYLSFSIPILFGFYISRKDKRFFSLFIVALITLLYTSARSSFIAYIVSITGFLLFSRKFKLYLTVVVITIALMFVSGEMAKRFQQTFQLRTVFVNEKTGDVKIDQRTDTTKLLPAGNFNIPLTRKKTVTVSDARLEQIATEKVILEAQKEGRKLNIEEIEKRAKVLAKFIKPQKTLLCDIACSTRLQIEWPRAIGAFLYSPLLGTGPSSIKEATDNDFLRWLGEFGLLGTTIFFFLLGSIASFLLQTLKKIETNEKHIYYGFLFGLVALLVNALYVDIFEASKIAYNFWIVAGLFTGLASLQREKSKILW